MDNQDDGSPSKMNFAHSGNHGFNWGLQLPYGMHSGDDNHGLDQMSGFDATFNDFQQYPDGNNMVMMSGVSGSLGPSPVMQQTAFPMPYQQQQQQQQQQQSPNVLDRFGRQHEQALQPQLSLMTPKWAYINWETDQAGSLGTRSPHDQLSAVEMTPGSSAFSNSGPFRPPERRPPQTPDNPTIKTEAHDGTGRMTSHDDILMMGDGIKSWPPHSFDTGDFTTTSAGHQVSNEEVQMPNLSYSEAVVKNLVRRDTSLHAPVLPNMPPPPPPINALQDTRRLSASSYTTDSSYAITPMQANKSQLLHSAPPSTAGATAGASLSVNLGERGVPRERMNSFRAVPSSRRRASDAQLGPPPQRPRQGHSQRACIHCYLSKKKCNIQGRNQCSNCVSAERECIDSRFDDQNIFVKCLPENLAKLVAKITKEPNWKKKRADVLLRDYGRAIDLNSPLEIISMMKLGHCRGHDLLFQSNRGLENDEIFGPLYQSCIILQSRAVLEKHESSMFRYTKEFEDNVLVLRAISTTRFFQMIEHRMEKNKIGKQIEPGSQRACNVTMVLGMLLLQTLGFHNSLPVAGAPDGELLEEERRDLAYNLAYRLSFMAKRALKNKNPNVEGYVRIGSDMSSISVDDKLWTELREAHAAQEAQTWSPGVGSALANSNTPFSVLTPSSATEADAGPDHLRMGGPAPPDLGRRGSAHSGPVILLRSPTGADGMLTTTIADEGGRPPRSRRGRRPGDDPAEFDDARDNDDVSRLTQVISTFTEDAETTVSRLTDDMGRLHVDGFLHRTFNTETGRFEANPEGDVMFSHDADADADAYVGFDDNVVFPAIVDGDGYVGTYNSPSEVLFDGTNSLSDAAIAQATEAAWAASLENQYYVFVHRDDDDNNGYGNGNSGSQ